MSLFNSMFLKYVVFFLLGFFREDFVFDDLYLRLKEGIFGREGVEFVFFKFFGYKFDLFN